MELKFVESKSSLKRRFGLFRARNQKKTSNSVVADAISKVNAGGGGGIVSCKEEDGVVRMKIVVKKSDLKQLIQAMSGGNGNDQVSYRPLSVTLPSLSVEQRLNLLRRKHLSRTNCNTVKGNRHNCWSPALQSIPEEL